MQDNALVSKIRKVITKRFLKHLEEEAKNEPEKYQKFWETFGIFLKEGATSDYEFQKEIGKLLRFESSKSEPGKQVSLGDYVLRMNPDQKEIYYINGPSREAIEAGPYVEMFRKKDIEIIYTMEPIDDFVLNHLGEFEEKKLVSADRADISLGGDDDKTGEKDEAKEKLDKQHVADLATWMQKVLEDNISEVIESKRLVDSPAMIVTADGYMTSTMERVLSANRKEKNFPGLGGGKKKLEINPTNALIKKLSELREQDEEFAREVARQIHDNAMIQAGLVVDPLAMVERNYRILGRVVGN